MFPYYSWFSAIAQDFRCTKPLPLLDPAQQFPDSTIVGRLFRPLLFLLARLTTDDVQTQVEFLKAETEMLRKRVALNTLITSSASSSPTITTVVVIYELATD